MKNYLMLADERAIDTIQETYLWFWDRTGVYVGMLAFTLYVIQLLFFLPLNKIDFVFMGFVGVFSGSRYVAQDKDIRLFNAMQREWRNARMRIVVMGVVFLTMTPVGVGYWRFIGAGTFWFAFSYLLCVQVRDRDPKEWFPRFKLARVQS